MGLRKLWVGFSLIVLSSELSGKALNIQSTLDFIENEKIENVAGFLNSSSIPHEYFQYFITLKKATRIQPASILLPRIISYDSEGRFIFSINGGIPAAGSKETRNESVEIMQYNATNKNYDFYSIHFYPGAAKPYILEGPNPNRCVNCHLQNKLMFNTEENTFNDSDLSSFKIRLANRDFTEDEFQRYKVFIWDHLPYNDLVKRFNQLETQ